MILCDSPYLSLSLRDFKVILTSQSPFRYPLNRMKISHEKLIPKKKKFTLVYTRLSTDNRDLKQQTFVIHGRRPEVSLRIFISYCAWHHVRFWQRGPRTACFRFSPKRPHFKRLGKIFRKFFVYFWTLLSYKIQNIYFQYIVQVWKWTGLKNMIYVWLVKQFIELKYGSNSQMLCVAMIQQHLQCPNEQYGIAME